MSCTEYESDLMELARGGYITSARRHAEVCHDCATFLEQQMALTELEYRLYGDEAAPGDLEGRLLAEFLKTRRPKANPPARWYGWWPGAAAIAAAMIFVWRPAPKAVPRPTVSVADMKPAAAIAASVVSSPAPKAIPRRTEPKEPTGADGDFLQVPYTQPVDPWERTEVRRMTMPVAALVAAGFPLNASDPGAEASADVLVGEDGRLRAVRLISISEREY
jgi:hypothetical protein